MKICLLDETGAGDGALSVLASRWGLEHDEDNLMALVMTPEHLELRKRDEPKLGGIFVDFVGGAMAHRRKFGGGRGEAVAKAVGVKGDYLPDVVDATAGLGRDAFVLASVGCHVRMLERNPVVAALLDDGLARGYADAEIGRWLQERLQLIHASSLTALTDITPRPPMESTGRRRLSSPERSVSLSPQSSITRIIWLMSPEASLMATMLPHSPSRSRTLSGRKFTPVRPGML